MTSLFLGAMTTKRSRRVNVTRKELETWPLPSRISWATRGERTKATTVT